MFPLQKWIMIWRESQDGHINPDMPIKPNILPNKLKLFFLGKQWSLFIPKYQQERSVSQKHLGLHLDQKLDFSKHIDKKISKAQKGIPVINPFLPNVPFWSPWKHQKTKGFLMFSGGSKGNIGKKRVKKLYDILPRNALLSIYKSFVRPYLDYGDIVYDQPDIQSFSNKIEAVQYNATLAITNAIKGTSRTTLY